MAVSWHRAKRKQIVWLLMKSLGNQPDTAKWGRSLTLPISDSGLLCGVTPNRPSAADDFRDQVGRLTAKAVT